MASKEPVPCMTFHDLSGTCHLHLQHLGIMLVFCVFDGQDGKKKQTMTDEEIWELEDSAVHCKGSRGFFRNRGSTEGSLSKTVAGQAQRAEGEPEGQGVRRHADMNRTGALNRASVRRLMASRLGKSPSAHLPK